jgi:1-acyl-sn-glycerol-3-phosphate acyltransferase/DNA-directed RNA polymerase subunit RPC12/RpoP
MKRPNLLLYVSLGFLVKIFAFLKGQRVTKKVKIARPAIILSNHTSFYDFIYTTAAMYPQRVSYLAANKMFYDPLLGFFLRLARAIPKSLFQSDPVATLKAFKILKNNGIISVFPEGQISPIGKSLTPSFSIAKFIKKARVDVYTVKHHNAYFVNPPWSKKSFSGRIETTKELIIKKENLETMSLNEIYDVVIKEIYFNAAAFNEKHKFTYRLNQIDNLENVIYQCPDCSNEGLEARKTHLFCPKCQHTFIYDKYGRIGNHGIDQLWSNQENTVQQEILSDQNYQLSSDVKLESFRNDRVVEVGFGRISLNRKEYQFKGIVDGVETTYLFDVKNTPTLPSDIGRNVQIYEGYQIYQFVFDDSKMPTKFVHAGEFMYKLSKENT